MRRRAARAALGRVFPRRIGYAAEVGKADVHSARSLQFDSHAVTKFDEVRAAFKNIVVISAPPDKDLRCFAKDSVYVAQRNVERASTSLCLGPRKRRVADER